ncbi:MAG: RNA methyltransferase [Agrobacterium sp.]|nr:RNA methyltransferase [Agrobacterium sp.]
MAGTNSELELVAEGPAIILVEPQLGENIGMVARAMANFGLAELRLVKPRDGWPSEKARAAASKADHVIDATKVFETLEEAIKDLNFVYATTARERYGFKPVRAPVTAAATLRTKFRADERTGILFGRERWGLTNEEVALADEIVTFPVNPAFASLNIAQAVLLMSYEWMKSGIERSRPTPRFRCLDTDARPSKQRFTACSSTWRRRSMRAAISVRPKKSRKWSTICGRCFTRAAASPSTEIQVLRGVISVARSFSPAMAPTARQAGLDTSESAIADEAGTDAEDE